MINADDMQSWAYLLAPTFQFVNTAGKPLTEGWIEVYIAGTRNKYYCSSDFNGTLHPFQIPLDSLGANIVLANPDQAYDVYVYNKYGSLVMSRYHVSPGMAGGSGVLNITITSEDGTVSVNNYGNGNFDLSIQDTVDRIEALEQTVSGLTSNSSVGYAIAHAYTVELDGSFDLISDAVTGIGYTPNMDGFRLKSGHVYQFNFNALFENGEFDRNCSGKLYLEGPNTIAQEWKFNLDDSYYHSQSINGSTVLVTPNYLNYYDVKLKLAWDVDYPNKPNVDLNKISIVDITTILSTTVSGVGGNYTGGDGIFVNDETYVISVDMDYINSHLNIDATEIIASAVNIATAYTDARVTSVSGDLVNLIAEVSANIPTGSVTQVQSDWNEQDSSSPAYIKHKPDLTVYATHEEVSGVSAVLNERINNVSGSIPELPLEEEVEFEEVDLSDYVTHNEVSAVSSNIVNYINSVSGDITNYVDESIVSAINVATGSFEQFQSDWTEDDSTDPAYIKNKPNEIEIVAGQNIGIFSDDTTITIAASSTDLSDYATHSEISSVSGTLNTAIANKKDKQTAYSSSGSNTKTITNVTQNSNGEISVTYSNISYPQQTPSVEIVSPSGTLNISSSTSGNTKTFSIDVAPTTGIEYGQFYATNITGAATMSRTKGNIDITNDGKIKLKKGQSYHITVRGRYNQSVLKDNYAYASYIEYVTNNSININVDESRSGSQYFELSYDLFKLNSDTDYYVFFTIEDATVNDLFIDVHSLSNVGGNGSSSGSSTEYDAGYGIQILNNVISVSGIAPQIQSDWNQTNSSSVDYIKNKPEEYGLLAGDNISITASGSNFIISSTASAATGTNYQAGYGIDITGNTISVDASIIPSTSDYATHSEVNTVSGTIVALIPDVSSLASKSEVNAVSGTLQTEIVAISGAMVDVPTGVSGVVAGQGIAITASGSDYVISCTVTGGGAGDVTRAELVSVSGTLETEIQVVSAAIPDTSNLATKVEVATASGTLNTKIDNVSASIPTLPSEEEVEFEEIDLNDYALASEIPDVSNLATKSELQTVSASIPDVSNFVTGPTVSAIVEESLTDIPTGVSGLVAGDNITITASGSNYVISGQDGGSTYSAGDYIGITDNTISVTGVTDVVAGNCVSITSSGNSAVIDWTTTGGITDIQLVNSLPASPVSTVLYLIPET